MSTTAHPAPPPHRTLVVRVGREVTLIAAFYVVYSAVRNSFGSAVVDPARALANAHVIIDIERSVGLFFEQGLQRLVIDAEWFVWALNVFYGSLHFVVTIGTLVWAFLRAPHAYRRWRNTLAVTTGLAIVGFSLFPVMPPRLLADCGPYGACAGPAMVDTVAEFGGLWSFDSGAMESMSNQYAAVPSLHMAWALWCALVLVPRITNRLGRTLLVAYPVVTFVAIVITANHFWLDAALGAATLGLASAVAVGSESLFGRARRAPASDPHTVSSEGHPVLCDGGPAAGDDRARRNPDRRSVRCGGDPW